jgi:hypothetical protein
MRANPGKLKNEIQKEARAGLRYRGLPKVVMAKGGAAFFAGKKLVIRRRLVESDDPSRQNAS